MQSSLNSDKGTSTLLDAIKRVEYERVRLLLIEIGGRRTGKAAIILGRDLTTALCAAGCCSIFEDNSIVQMITHL